MRRVLAGLAVVSSLLTACEEPTEATDYWVRTVTLEDGTRCAIMEGRAIDCDWRTEEPSRQRDD